MPSDPKPWEQPIGKLSLVGAAKALEQSPGRAEKDTPLGDVLLEDEHLAEKIDALADRIREVLLEAVVVKDGWLAHTLLTETETDAG